MRKVFSLLLGMLLVSGVDIAHAGFIVDAFSTGNVTIIQSNLAALNNDDQTNANLGDILTSGGGNFNWVALKKEFDSLSPIDIAFTVLPTQGTTEYFIVEALSNVSGTTWTDYHLQLGVGYGDTFVVLSDVGADQLGLDFDTPDRTPSVTSLYLNNTTIFNSVVHNPDSINFEDGLIPENAANADISQLAFVTYSLDVPDIENAPNGYQFTLRQFPTSHPVPEPTTMLLLGGGLLGAFFRRTYS